MRIPSWFFRGEGLQGHEKPTFCRMQSLILSKKSFPFWQDQGIISAKRLLYRMAGAIRSRRLTAALMANYTIPLRFMV